MRINARQVRAVSKAVQVVIENLETRRMLSTVYVSATAPGGNSGADWFDAYVSLQSALANANPGDVIEVGKGTYYPTNSGDPTASFQIGFDETIEGGFAGYGASNPDARSITQYPTILSGAIGGTPSYNVVTSSGDNTSSTLDGFTITGGNADGTGFGEIDQTDGGGMYVFGMGPTISDCTFTGDTANDAGGALAVETYTGQSTSATVIDCTFTDNTASAGGAIIVLGASVTLTDCTINDNTASQSGGALAENGATMVVTGCTIDGDSAGTNGGAVYAYRTASAVMTSCTLDGDSAANGGAISEDYSTVSVVQCAMAGDTATTYGAGIYNANSTVSVLDSTITGDNAGKYSAIANYGAATTTVGNSIIWGDGPNNANEIDPSTTATFSDIDQSFNFQPYPGTGNTFGNPFFVRIPGTNGPSDYGNLDLQADSYAIDMGSNALLPITLTSDIAGNPRVYNGTVDMGAYEYFPNVPLPDLEPTNLSTGSPSVNFGGSVDFMWTDQNVGNATAAGGYYDDIYLSNTPQLTASSTLLYVISPSQPTAAGSSQTFGVALSIPAETRSFEQGTYYLIVRANATFDDSESNESNNDASIAIQITHQPQTYYVDADTPASPANQTGLSWADAVPSLQTGLNLAFPSDTILVAQGTYLPTTTTDQTISFQLPEDIALYGGYGGNELKVAGGNPNTRNVVAYPTILSGLIDGSANPTMASYNVVTTSDVDSSTVLDGVTITGGYGYFSQHPGGGGMFIEEASPTINDCTFTGNFATIGGGLLCNDFSSPTVTNCSFTNDTASQGGGMACVDYSSPTVTNCSFTGDTGSEMYSDGNCTPIITNCTFTSASGALGAGVSEYRASPTFIDCIITGCTADDGGAAYNDGGAPTFIDCILSGDTATGAGGAIDDYSTSLTLTNCLIEGDGANEGGAIYSYGNRGGTATEITNCTIANDTAKTSAYGAIGINTTTMTIANSIIYGDGPNELGNAFVGLTATYSDVQGGLIGAGNINADPQFVNASGGNFQLLGTSPCVNKGDNNAPGLSGISTDLAGNPRIVGGTVDMGAYELQSFSVIWTGGGGANTNWSDAANWSDDAVPTSFDDATVPTGFAQVKVGTGTFAVHSLTASSTITIAGGSLTLDNASVIGPSLIFSGGGEIDILNNMLKINYGTSSDPVALIRGDLAGGYAGGAWNGSGIISSAVATANTTQSKLIYDVGYADGKDGVVAGLSSGTIEILPTLAGDAKLAGNVVFGDFQLLAASFGLSGGWDQGNFTYGSLVNFGDFQLLAQNFGQTSSLPASSGGASGLATAPASVTAPSIIVADSSGDDADGILNGNVGVLGQTSPFSDGLGVLNT